ncbi:MAG: glycerol-3-phosphate dehydrogenase/oxidase [Bacteroidales bacterium]|nr:glycerol-3-phosphate dehydrogenase/oxidase [Bacteroidales bacterium]
MNRFIENYDNTNFDLIVVGGGITGATVAYEAASRGLSVALLEKSDFASATSSATSKMIHGGLRYLSTFEFSLVRESLKERRVLMNIAPNFVHPAPFIFSVYKKDKVPNYKMKIGMLLYELFSFDKNKLWDKSRKMPNHQSISPERVIELVPGALKEGLVGGQLYYDCSSHSPERLTLAFIKSAVKYGALVANYAEVEDFVIEKNKKLKIIKGVKIIDKLRNEKLVVNGKMVINCAGPWADILLGKAREKHEDEILRRSEGIHFITKKLVEEYTFSGATPDGKHFFLVPYRNHTLIGTTDKEYIGKPDEYKVTKQAITELLDEVNQSFGEKEKIRYEEIVYAYGGLRPLVEDQTEDVYHSSRKYEITGEKKNGIAGLITVEGGKFTTSRMLAEKAVNKAIRILKMPKKKSISENSYIYGSEIKNFQQFIKEKQVQYPDFKPQHIEFLAKSYGTEIDKLFSLMNENTNLKTILNEDGENLAQVVYAIRFEMAKTLPDILMRRTGIGQLGHPGKNILEKTAQIAAKELNWDKDKMAEEIAKTEQLLQVP